MTCSPSEPSKGKSVFPLNPAIRHGLRIAHAVYSLFEQQYGIDVRFGRDGNARPYAGVCDLGAYDFGSALFSAGFETGELSN